MSKIDGRISLYLSAFAAGNVSGINPLGVLKHGAKMKIGRLHSKAPLSFGPMATPVDGVAERHLGCRPIVRLDPNAIAGATFPGPREPRRRRA